jgi:hypothetical protein
MAADGVIGTVKKRRVHTYLTHPGPDRRSLKPLTGTLKPHHTKTGIYLRPPKSEEVADGVIRTVMKRSVHRYFKRCDRRSLKPLTGTLKPHHTKTGIYLRPPKSDVAADGANGTVLKRKTSYLTPLRPARLLRTNIHWSWRKQEGVIWRPVGALASMRRSQSSWRQNGPLGVLKVIFVHVRIRRSK